MAPDGAGPPPRHDDPDLTAVEDIVARFLLEREEGRHPSIDDYLARHPKHAEVLARLLSDDTASPATMRRPSSRGRAATGAPTSPAIGPYDVLEHVSTAGGGTVYRARHREGGHVVALKVLDSRGAVDPRDVERFHREAGMLRAMNLVHVVPVLDSGDEGGRNWIAMKWLEGDTFSKLREAALDASHRLFDLRERARLVARVARTFAAIHAYGILHRDVKPTNIMVDRTGEPMIIDFGIAHAPDLPELTATTDQIMGTPRFLAPELLAGGNREVSPRTDVYGLGLCLYELCTGTEAFKQQLRADMFTAIRTTGPVHPRVANPALSHDFAAVILRAIEIDPARRYPDMAALADDLERIARGESPEPATLRGAHPLLRAIRRNKKRLVAATCLAAIVVPALWLYATRWRHEMRARDLEAQLQPFVGFSPEAFADGLGVPPRVLARELADSKAATPDRRLVAAWTPFLAGEIDEALGCLGPPVPEDGFAKRLFHAHLSALASAGRQAGQSSEAHVFVPTLDPETNAPVVNPKTGEEMEFLVPMSGAGARDRARFDQAVKDASSSAPPAFPIDHLVLATLHWSIVASDPAVDMSARRAAIGESLSEAVDAAATKVAALYLRGVMAWLQGDLKAARDDLAAVVSAQPAAPGPRYLHAIVLTRLGDHRKGLEEMESVARELPKSHGVRSRMLGHLAIARARAGDPRGAEAACDAWVTASRGREKEIWQDSVIPRVLAAQLWREHGDLVRAKELLLQAVSEDERIKMNEKESEERDGEMTRPPLLWGTAFRELCSVAEALGDADLLKRCRAKMATVGLMPLPKSAESYLDLDLAGLRPPDFDHVFVPPLGIPRDP